MLDEFELINMNARLYDPKIGQFLAVDNFVQDPGFSQSYNRYSYVWNNPLKYTDPSGEIIGTAFTFLWDLGATLFTKGGINPTNTKENRKNAWKEFDPTSLGSKTNNAWKIDAGLFKTDENRNVAGRFLQLAARFTWEVRQTSLGNIVSHSRNIAGTVDKVDYYNGATVVDNSEGNGRWGLTLGPYINTSRIGELNEHNQLLNHEYGHVLQSQLLGFYYLGRIAIPSGISGFLDYSTNSDHDHDYTWFEIDANKRAYKYLNKHYTSKGLSSTNDDWNEDDPSYPRHFRNIDRKWFILFNPLIF
jgi:RHS repeat-associated protein